MDKLVNIAAGIVSVLYCPTNTVCFESGVHYVTPPAINWTGMQLSGRRFLCSLGVLIVTRTSLAETDVSRTQI